MQQQGTFINAILLRNYLLTISYLIFLSFSHDSEEFSNSIFTAERKIYENNKLFFYSVQLFIRRKVVKGK